ncbi:MAG: FG-GAP-like repeat-containing protein [Planctomycetota bacterium]|jgi:hypothetical protein
MNSSDPKLHAPHAAALLAAIGLSASALGALTVDPATSVSAGTQPSGLASGDFDGDLDRDLVTTVDDANDIVVLLNNGSGQYSMGPNSNLPPSSSPQDVVAGRLDGDTIMDLAVAVRDPAGAVIILLGNGNATFTMSSTITVGDRPRGLSIADIDGDGDLDLAVANRDSASASVLTNDGSGSFTAQTVAVGGEARFTALGDFDDDTDLDLAVTNSDGRSVEIFENTAGTFSFSETLFVNPATRPDGVVAADLDGDTKEDDLAVGTSDGTLGINQVAVFLSGPAGFSGPSVFDTGGTNTSEVAAADLDCDGLNDLVTSNSDSNNLSLLTNTGAGAFGPAMLQAAGTTPGDLDTGDFDGDGDSDIAAANRDSNDVSVLINQTCVPCPADIDGDGVVDVRDFLALLAAWGPNPGHPADINGDGTVGVNDFLELLANWGGCP